LKKICCLIPSLGPGGMERVMSELVSYFHSKRDIEIDLILYGRSREVFFSIPDEVRIHKPEFVYSSTFRILFTLRTILFLRQTIKKVNPDVLLSFGEDWNNLVLLSTIGLNYPVYVADRAEPGKTRRPVQEFLRNKLYPWATGIIVQTEKAREIYQKKFPGNSIVAIPNPFKTLNYNENIDRENIVLSVGRLIKSKHYDLLINMFSEIENDDWKLVIVGGNAVKQDEMTQLQEIIKQRNLENKVVLTGMISDVESWYKKSKIFAFTSSSEGFPNVIGEAMQFGLPIIAFDCVAGPADMIDHGENGFLIPLFEKEIYKSKLQDLMNNEELRKKMSKISSNKIKEFSLEKVGDKFLNYLVR